MALRSWQSLPEIAKIALSKEFFDFLEALSWQTV